MIYILNYGDSVRLGGTVANYNMFAEGWVPYHGPIPEGHNFKLVDGVLVCTDPPVPAEETTETV